MLFNSLDFAIFLPIVFILYWFIAGKKLSSQNLLLLVASYFFYACWDWRFLFLLAFSTFLDYYTGIKISEAPNKRKKRSWLCCSIIINLGFLGFFKYYNFFAASFISSVEHLGIHLNPWTLSIILPLGISFYTFHGLSYVLDIFNNKIKPERNIIDYAVFVSFFPLLIAGPIERATHLLPQVKQKRVFDQAKAVDGLRQILWGLFKKIVIADNCAAYANMIFSNHTAYPGSTLLLGALFFTFQIYCDFSGYSDIAIGTARLFGINLLRNFAFPYFSRDIAEFWRRWHISLSSWFRDYLYIPLGGSRGGTWMKIRNTFIIFIVSGFWHGANWTFIVWGTLNALYFMPLLLMKKNRIHLGVAAQGRTFPTLKECFQIALTFSLTVLAWIFFRAKSVADGFDYLRRIFSRSLLTIPQFDGKRNALIIMIVTMLFMIIEWQGRNQQYGIAGLGATWKRPVRWAMYYLILLTIFFFAGTQQKFIYFQF